ncbi:MAG: ABC transporter permease [Anaerolineae bacterium]|nr:ABC transporter permease [Anaerolineae bacterium]
MASSTHASSLINSDADQRQAAPEIPLWQRRWRSFWGSYSSRIGLIVTVIIFLMALVPTSWLPYNPTEVNLAIANQPGVWAGEWSHPLGTDFLGRDMLSRTIHGARLTLIISGSAVVLATVVGVLLGMVAGFYGHWIDEFISWLIDIQLAFPVIVLALAIIAILGGSLTSLIIVLAITSWATMARLVRGQILSARNEVYVEAAEAIGATTYSILVKHLLPNIFSPILAVATFEMSRLVLTESALSFLGLGVAPPQVTWGGMIGDGRAYVYDAWWTATVPGLMIAILVIAFNFLGDGLRDAFDPNIWTGRK